MIKYRWILFNSIFLFKILRILTNASVLKRLEPVSVVVSKATSSQRGFLVLQVGEVFINGLEPNIMDCFRLPSSLFEICFKCRLATVFLNRLAHSE